MWQSWVGKKPCKERRKKKARKTKRKEESAIMTDSCVCAVSALAPPPPPPPQQLWTRKWRKEGERKIEAIFCRLKCGGCVLCAFSAVSLFLFLHRLMTDYSCIGGGGGGRLSRRCCTLVLVSREFLSQLCHHSIAGRRRGETVRLLFFPRCFFSSSLLFCFHRPLPRLLSLFYCFPFPVFSLVYSQLKRFSSADLSSLPTVFNFFSTRHFSRWRSLIANVRWPPFFHWFIPVLLLLSAVWKLRNCELWSGVQHCTALHCARAFNDGRFAICSVKKWEVNWLTLTHSTSTTFTTWFISSDDLTHSAFKISIHYSSHFLQSSVLLHSIFLFHSFIHPSVSSLTKLLSSGVTIKFSLPSLIH